MSLFLCEVILLPYCHLVAYKECAINMIEFDASGTIMHMEVPLLAKTAKMPVIADAIPLAAVTESAGEDQPISAAVLEIVVANAELPIAEPLEMSVQPTRNKEPAVASVQAPSQAAPAPLVLSTPIDPPRTVPP
jgi:hypothetical protein